jgi:hypothetical protein
MNTETHVHNCMLMRFGTVGTRLTGVGEKNRGPTTSWPTQPRDLGQEAHNLRNLIDKSCKIGK